ncbi:hypothetical protein [Streptomyces sp. NPDC096152]|uniref:hypothetical protein n=1 Tax=Streptomyces sp. NPDC096152 TaxID=3366078 RepID=UPI0037F2E5BF
MRTPDLNGGTGGFGRPMVTGLAHATAVTRRASGGRTAVVTRGAVITGRLAAEAVWKQRGSDVLRDSARLGEFATVFDAPVKRDGPTTHLHFHVARILQGQVGIPETGGMYRVAIEDVSAWTVGDFSYSHH